MAAAVRHPRPVEPAPWVKRDFFNNRFVYCVISQRARGLSIGINMNPDMRCNFDCVYCEVDRTKPVRDKKISIRTMASELHAMLTLVQRGDLQKLPIYQNAPDDLFALKEVALSGDGEPTLCPIFEEVVRAVMDVRARGAFPSFKIVLITNCSGLDQPGVQRGIEMFAPTDEIWAKLDGGTQAYINDLNRPGGMALNRIMRNILLIAQKRPVIIQSLFPLVENHELTDSEVDHYVSALRQLRDQGAVIDLVQIHSTHRPAARPGVSHQPLKVLAHIARRVREATGLNAEVF